MNLLNRNCWSRKTSRELLQSRQVKTFWHVVDNISHHGQSVSTPFDVCWQGASTLILCHKSNAKAWLGVFRNTSPCYWSSSSQDYTWKHNTKTTHTNLSCSCLVILVISAFLSALTVEQSESEWILGKTQRRHPSSKQSFW